MSENLFIYPLRIHIEDTDFTGIVYHSNYLKFMERARSEWAELVGMGLDYQRSHQIFFVVHSVQLFFLKPARLHEQVEVVSRIKVIGGASLTYDQYLRPRHSPDKILCKAEIKIACTDGMMLPSAVPDAPFLKRVAELLNTL
ncbi:MAG: hypothetical protein A3F12_02450 [Gammaproteobacteria bacterium RIFCSPHIGHO2_12_FULL_38_14]|nr:MAG: hypothetical protein A3F12_02450 [Gammaproteobacteria bacterium RIFCSPHIGHO2_12_FULL_38_14]